MSSAYDSSFHKISRVGDLVQGKPRAFRAAGVIVVLELEEDGRVTAIDGSDALPVKVENGEVWVCIDACRP